jgi:hypothetical protein
MTKQVLCSVLIGMAAVAVPGAAAAQDWQPARAERLAMVEADLAQLTGKLRAAVEMKTTLGAPYSAEATTEFVQTLADGNRIARKSTVRIYRDSEGRVRRENLTADGRVESVTIADPVNGNHVLLDPETRTAHASRVRTAGVGRGGAIAPDAERKRIVELEARRQAEGTIPPPPPAAPPPPSVVPPPPPAAPPVEAAIVAPVPLPPGGGPATVRMRAARAGAGSEQVSRQDLGQRTFEGVGAKGTRTTTMIPAGAIGNDQPIRIVSEEWFSPELQLLVLTRHSDPRTGESTYALSSIVRGEPDRALFEVPADYTRK